MLAYYPPFFTTFGQYFENDENHNTDNNYNYTTTCDTRRCHSTQHSTQKRERLCNRSTTTHNLKGGCRMLR